ncbi:MAG: hypothetical protein BYD32DRAFT_409647 [Podila humilis]|nr:MAG: hypothetical protein BYD32DRAFT_409647 [Podila humilis]
MKGISAYASVGCSWFLLGSLVDVSVVHFVTLLCCILLILGDPLLPCHISLCGDWWWDSLLSTTDIDAVLCNGVEECSGYRNSINIKKLRLLIFVQFAPIVDLPWLPCFVLVVW